MELFRDTPPSSEQDPTLRESVIGLLASRGRNDLETKRALASYLDQQEAIANGVNTSIVNIERGVEIAKMYREAGLVGPSREYLMDCMDAARSEKDDELISYIEETMDELEGRGIAA